MKKYIRVGVIVCALALVAAVVLGLAGVNSFLGMGLKDRHVLKLDIKQDFSAKDVASELQSLSGKMGDYVVLETNMDMVPMAMIYMERAPEGIQDEALALLRGKYEGAAFRSIELETKSNYASSLFGYIAILALAALLVSLYYGLRAGVHGGLGLFLAGLMSMVTAVSVMLTLGVPITINTLVASCCTTLLVTTLYTTAITLVGAPIDKEEWCLTDTLKNNPAITITFIGFVIFAVGGMILGTLLMRRFIIAVFAGVFAGYIQSLYVAVPITIGYGDRVKAPARKKRSK